MQVRVPTFEFTDEERRAIRFAQKRRKTPCSRREARQFITDAVARALSDARYRWDGPSSPALTDEDERP